MGRHFLKQLSLGFVGLAGLLTVCAGIRIAQDVRRVATRVSLPGHVVCASALTFTPDGRRLFTADWSGTVRMWQVPSGKLLGQSLCGNRALNTVAVSPDGGQLAAGDDGGFIWRWEAATGRRLPSLNVGLPVRRVVFSPDSRELAAVAHGLPAVLRFDAATGRLLGRFDTPHPLAALAYAPDGSIAAGGAGGIMLWNRHTGKRFLAFGSHDETGSLTFSPDGKTLVACGLLRGVTAYRVRDGAIVRRLKVDQPGNAAFLPQGNRFLLGCGADLRVYDTLTGNAHPSLTPPALLSFTPTFLMRVFPRLRDFQQMPVQTLALSPNTEYVAFSVQDTVTLLPLRVLSTQK